MTNNHLSELRRMLVEDSAVEWITVIDGSVFPTRSVDCAIVTTRPGKASKNEIAILHAEP